MLALELGMTVAEMESRMSALEYTRWAAYFRLQHEREHRAHMREKNRTKSRRR